MVEEGRAARRDDLQMGEAVMAAAVRAVEMAQAVFPVEGEATRAGRVSWEGMVVCPAAVSLCNARFPPAGRRATRKDQAAARQG